MFSTFDGNPHSLSARRNECLGPQEPVWALRMPKSFQPNIPNKDTT